VRHRDGERQSRSAGGDQRRQLERRHALRSVMA
jgi:hypothetical protein